MTADPFGWVGEQLSDLDALVERSDVDPGLVDPDDARQLRDAVPEILDAVQRLFTRIEHGELATAPASAPAPGEPVRAGWL